MTLGAWAYGLAWQTTAGKVLDSWFPQAELAENLIEQTALHPAGAPPEFLALAVDDAFRGLSRVVIKVVIPDLSVPPADVYDAYLRLHLLSMRKVAPHGLNLEGIFVILPNVVWTNYGPCLVEDFERTRLLLMQRGQLQVYGIDKFPRMVDYVLPTGVRIADANRVRLGAHLAEGTTVMHEGFVNFNAGTLGNSMVEGRISAGVVIGVGSDIGGGASIMGTLSGGGKEVITIGERCLIGANAGVGISLGDDSVIEAGLYITAGTKVTLPSGEIVKAKTLSGQSGLLFIRDSRDGIIKALPHKGAGIELNSILHAN